jgi:hypothetical protein
MHWKTGIRSAAIGIALIISTANTQNGPKISGYGSYEAGQIVRGVFQNQNGSGAISHAWVQKLLFGIEIEATAGERLRFVTGGEGRLDFSYQQSSGTFLDQYLPNEYPAFSFVPTHVEAIIRIVKNDPVELEAGSGLFPYKYNPDARNLGEFLFRSELMPQFLRNNFDQPFQRLLGLRLGNTIFSRFHQDLLLTSETNNYPLCDFSLSWVGNANFQVVDIGLGISLHRIFPINQKQTAPEKPENLMSGTDTTRYYSFAGTKCMARISLDPKAFFTAPILGKNDLRFYAEAALLGWDEDSLYYHSIEQRVPVMFGFNFPAFAVLDVCALEAEWWDNPYPNSYYQAIKYGYPHPVVDPLNLFFKHDKWRWSVYASKTLFRGLTLTGQAAHDHLIPYSASFQLKDQQDVLPDTKHWWWVLKIGYGF